MSISDRYRALAAEVSAFAAEQQRQAGAEPTESLCHAFKSLDKAIAAIGELLDGVGDVPRIRLEVELTPVLLKAHNHIDRGRLDFIEAGADKAAAAAWDLQQAIYRLLNDL